MWIFTSYSTFFTGLRPCVLCDFGLCILEPVLYSVTLTIVHLDGTPVLSLHNIMGDLSPGILLAHSCTCYFIEHPILQRVGE
jgi:hypothetical protein